MYISLNSEFFKDAGEQLVTVLYLFLINEILQRKIALDLPWPDRLILLVHSVFLSLSGQLENV